MAENVFYVNFLNGRQFFFFAFLAYIFDIIAKFLWQNLKIRYNNNKNLLF